MTKSKNPPPERGWLDGAAMITFTSGSTSKPKGVVPARNRMSAKLATIREAIRMDGAPKALVPLQLHFSFGQWATFLPLIMGGGVHITTRFSSDWANKILQDQPVTTLRRYPPCCA